MQFPLEGRCPRVNGAGRVPSQSLGDLTLVWGGWVFLFYSGLQPIG